MSEKKTTGADQSTAQLLQKTFRAFYDYVASATGAPKALRLAEHSHNYLLSYFKNLQKFSVNETAQLTVPETVTDNDVLAFSVWMQQYLKQLTDFMIGLGTIDIQQITEQNRQFLESIHFYEYFEQAKELAY